eukprot:3723336-Karenia_brevis.AAC.1
MQLTIPTQSMFTTPQLTVNPFGSGRHPSQLMSRYQVQEMYRRRNIYGTVNLAVTPVLLTQTFLEKIGITQPTYNDYHQRALQFLTWCIQNRHDWKSDEELDAVLIVFMDCMFWGGLPPDCGIKLLASIKFFIPWFSRDGHGALPRAHR